MISVSFIDIEVVVIVIYNLFNIIGFVVVDYIISIFNCLFGNYNYCDIHVLF